MRAFNKRSSLLTVLVCLTLLSVSAQISLFVIHNHAAELLDTLVSSSLPTTFFHQAVLLPLLNFIFIQILAYTLFIGFIWFITQACSEFFKLPAYELGIFFWFVGNLAVFLFNQHYFPTSFFSGWGNAFPFAQGLQWLTASLLIAATCLAYYLFFYQKRFRLLGSFYLFCFVLVLGSACLNLFSSRPQLGGTGNASRPHIILIGLDSLRPDYLSYGGKKGKGLATPHIDQFIKTGVVFTDAYTPLARTFPAWVSILTSKYPKNSHARVNLSFAQPIQSHTTLAKELKKAGYQTIYATDEKRFSNITEDYGFDQIVGPKIGLGDFILGGLSDFPLTNLMINLPLGRFLFPYNYGNRAAAITYEPDKFIQLVKTSLHQRTEKPLFLALHFCLTHWPYTWAETSQKTRLSMEEHYRLSIEAVDKQLGELLQVLKENGLLQQSLVILLSDHGTTFGLPGERLLTKKRYQGDPAKLKWVTLNKLSTTPASSLNLKESYSLNTAYGQGTDVLSLKQYQIVLAFNYFNEGEPSFLGAQKKLGFKPQALAFRSSLLDLAPTILAFLHLAPMPAIDGHSLLPYLLSSSTKSSASLPLFLETGHSISEIETNDIKVEKVLKKTIDLYELDPVKGYLFIKPSAEQAILESKQRAVLLGNWLLARYPPSLRTQLSPSGVKMLVKTKTYLQPAYYVLTNIKTGAWTIDWDTALAKEAPLVAMLGYFKTFYGKELSSSP
jgi:hypothetical protein